MDATSLGQAIVTRRKKLGLTQKQLALMVHKEDGEPITPQYLNDVERDRRRPTPFIVQRIAEALGGDADELHRLARQLPPDIDPMQLAPDKWSKAMKAFRKG